MYVKVHHEPRSISGALKHLVIFENEGFSLLCALNLHKVLLNTWI